MSRSDRDPGPPRWQPGLGTLTPDYQRGSPSPALPAPPCRPGQQDQPQGQVRGWPPAHGALERHRQTGDRLCRRHRQSLALESPLGRPRPAPSMVQLGLALIGPSGLRAPRSLDHCAPWAGGLSVPQPQGSPPATHCSDTQGTQDGAARTEAFRRAARPEGLKGSRALAIPVPGLYAPPPAGMRCPLGQTAVLAEREGSLSFSSVFVTVSLSSKLIMFSCQFDFIASHHALLRDRHSSPDPGGRTLTKSWPPRPGLMAGSW